MIISQEERPAKDNYLVRPITDYIDNGQPLDPEVIIGLGKNKYPSTILHFAIEQSLSAEPTRVERTWGKTEETKEREERIRKLFRFIGRKTIQIEAGDIESSWNTQGSRSRSTESTAYSARAGLAIVRHQYEGN